MRVFISWSGERSKTIAEVIRQWLPAVIQAVRPYFSPDDITKGARWSSEIARELSESRVGIICLTRENLESPWVMFEAGALSKSLDNSRVCPLLFGVEPTDIVGPLVSFQAAKFEKPEMKRVVRMINAELGEGALVPEILDSVFEMWWPQLDSRISEELGKSLSSSPVSLRSERDILEEILERTRSLSLSGPVQQSRISPAALDDLTESYLGLIELMQARGDCDDLLEAARRLELPVGHMLRRSGLESKAKSLRNLLRRREEKTESVVERSEGE